MCQRQLRKHFQELLSKAYTPTWIAALLKHSHLPGYHLEIGPINYFFFLGAFYLGPEPFQSCKVKLSYQQNHILVWGDTCVAHSLNGHKPYINQSQGYHSLSK